jgi:hypothetical protein
MIKLATQAQYLDRAHNRALKAILDYADQGNQTRALHFRRVAGRIAQLKYRALTLEFCALWAVASCAAPSLEVATKRLAVQTTETLYNLEKRIRGELRDHRLRAKAHEALEQKRLPWGGVVSTYQPLPQEQVWVR